MVVDDHDGVRALIRELLRDCLSILHHQPPQFIECRSGEEAVRAVGEFVPDLVTVDLRMEGMDGRECVRRLRGLAPRAVLIVVTGLDREIAWRCALQAGADSLVLKDDLTSIQGMVRDWVSCEAPT